MRQINIDDFMPKPLINPIVFWSFLAIILVIIFAVGFITSKQNIDIAGCKAEWQSAYITSRLCPSSNENFSATCQGRIITSPTCPGSNETYNATCLIESYVDQHNAITNAILCACDKARSGSEYPNQQINTRIIEVYKQQYGSDASIQEVCETGLVKLRY